MVKIGVNSVTVSIADAESVSTADLVLLTGVATPKDSAPFDVPRPCVMVKAAIVMHSSRIRDVITRIEHSLQVSCLASPTVLLGMQLLCKLEDLEPFEKCYAAKAADHAVAPDPKRIQCFLNTQALLSATDVDATTVEFPDQCARVDVCLALNCDVGFTVDSALQAVVFDNGLHDPRLSHDAIPRALLEQISAPFVALLPLQTDAVGPLGVCVSVAPLAGFANLLVLLNVHTVKGRPSLQLGAAHATIKFALDRLVKNMQRRHPHIFVPKRILQARAVIPQVAAAMTAIISRSPNRAFQDECMRLLKLAPGADVKAYLATLLESSLHGNAVQGADELLADGSVPDASLSDEDLDEEED